MSDEDEGGVTPFHKIVRDFVHDIVRVFPERAETMDGDLRMIAVDDPGAAAAAVRVRAFVMERMPKSFFDVLYQNDKIFEEEDAGPMELLPGLSFTELWKIEGVSDATKETIWKYLQLMLFNVVGDLSDRESFGDAANLFEAIDEDELRRKLEETVSHMQSVFESQSDGDASGADASGVDGEGSIPGGPSAADVHSHITGMLDGKLGALAKEIAKDTADELGLDIDGEGDGETSVNQVFQKLFKNPGKLISLVKKMGGKLDSKIKSGEIKESELLEEATQFMGKMKSMPGMENMQSMLSKMGMGGGGGGGKSKAGMAAFQSHMQQNIKHAKTRERMQAKLEARKATQEGPPKESVFTVGEGAERTPRPVSGTSAIERQKKKKRRRHKKTTTEGDSAATADAAAPDAAAPDAAAPDESA